MSWKSGKDLEAYAANEMELKDLLGMEAAYIEVLKGRAQLFVEGGRTERALIMLEMLEALDRRDVTPSLVAAELLIKEGRSDAAEAKIESILARMPEHPDALVAKAELKIAIGELAPAAAILKKVIDGDPQASTAAGKRALAVAVQAHHRLGSSESQLAERPWLA